jgi:hypothetical protein
MKINYFSFDQLRLISGSRFINYLFIKFTAFYVVCILLLNYRNLRQKRFIFINSFAFGHSVIETSIFFGEFASKSLCISVGSKKHRNKYLSLLYKPFVVINFWLPNILDISVYQAVRKRCHSIIEYKLKNSRLINYIFDSNLEIIDREILLHNSAVKSLSNIYSVSAKKATKLIEDIDFQYVSSLGHQSSCSLHILAQQKSFITPNTEAFTELSKKFIDNSLIQKNSSQQNLMLCTLILRKSWKAWSGNGLATYAETIKYLNQKNYIVNIVGDIEQFVEMRDIFKFEAAYCSYDYGYNSKVFQILSIMNSSFCIADVSGLLTLSLFFNKKNLVINSIPFAHVYHNSITLPRNWCRENGTPVDKSEIVENLLYRIHPFKINNSGLFPRYHDSGTVLKAAQSFVTSVENDKDLNGVKPDQFFPIPTVANYSTRAFYSPLINDFYV